MEGRSDHHYVDERGNNTSHWFEKKRRVDLDGDGVIECLDSSNVQEVMVCPATAGKEAAHSRTRQAKQLCQAMAPTNYGKYNGIRSLSAAPATPGRSAALERTIPFQGQRRDVPEKPTPRVVPKHLWTPRRGELRAEMKPPPEHEMFRNAAQLRTESHMDVADQNFADALVSSRKNGTSTTSAMATSGVNTARSMFPHDQCPKPAAAMVRHSLNRLGESDNREISEWHLKVRPDRLKREDPFNVKPVAQSGSSSVKYDIISNERKQFWY